MDVPATMTTPKMKLNEGETILLTQSGLRKSGWFGNRFGQLHITNQRVAFVKSIMRAGLISAAADKLGAKPMLSIPRDAVLSAHKAPFKKQMALVVSVAGKEEKFLIDEVGIDAAVEMLGQVD